MFQPLDSALESIMNAIDRDFGPGTGSRVMKVVLLLLPLVCLIFFVAFRTLNPSSSTSTLAEEFALPGTLFAPSSPTARKHNTSGKQH